MVNVEMDISPIMALPEDVRSVIFNLIPQKETVNLRLVCKSWNQEIQDNYEYDIKRLDEDSQNFKSILKLRIKNLGIQRLEITPVYNIFKHPNAIQKLVIREDALIPQLNLHQLIDLVSKNLRVLKLLDVNYNLQICNYRFPSDLSFNFKHLKHLSIRGCQLYNLEQCEDNPRSLFHVFENSSFPNLKTLRVILLGSVMTLEAKARIVGNLLRLISKHGKYLEEITVFFSHFLELVELPVPLQEEELLRINQIQTLKKVHLSLLPVWIKVLCNQKQLKELCIFLHELSLNSSVSLIQQITQNNSATLDQIVIKGHLLSPSDPAFDLSIFQNCPGLKVLQLNQAGAANIARARADPDQLDVVNFHSLPQNLIELELEGLKILSEEVLIAFRSNNNTTGAKGFKKLQKLSLMVCGNQGLFGVNSVVLYEIMMTPRPSLIYVDFSDGVHNEEAGINTILSQLQLSHYIYDWFRLKWNSDELGWNFVLG